MKTKLKTILAIFFMLILTLTCCGDKDKYVTIVLSNRSAEPIISVTIGNSANLLGSEMDPWEVRTIEYTDPNEEYSLTMKVKTTNHTATTLFTNDSIVSSILNNFYILETDFNQRPK